MKKKNLTYVLPSLDSYSFSKTINLKKIKGN